MQLLKDDEIQYMIHHVFLPARLPNTGHADTAAQEEVARNDDALLKLLADTLHDGLTLFDGPERLAIQTAASMIADMREILDVQGAVDEVALSATLCKLFKPGKYVLDSSI